MRYKLPVDRLVNSLMPHYLSGRRFILFVQSCLYPLQSLNERFRAFARERHIEARMTSQVIYFEWFLNHRFGKYICSFVVCVPAVNITHQDLVYMLSYVVNTYKLAGKTYLIKIDKEEYQPNKNITP